MPPQKTEKKMNRIVTGIEELDKKRCKVFINQEFAFVLYKGELFQYGIGNEKEIDDSTYHEIMDDILVKRARKRCLNLLQKRPYTEQKLRQKLKEGWYPLEIEENAISYVKSFHYIDDYDYACQYIFYHKETESRRKIEEKLLIKGVSKETLKKAFEDSYEEGEQYRAEWEQLLALLNKKKYDKQKEDWKEKRRVYTYLIRKGFGADMVQKAMDL